jgi:histidinol-phosphate/aromatic aminotransferase/cobyric acid decarboxylase-like protein
MEAELRKLGIDEFVPGETNSLMFHLDDSQPSAAEVIERAREGGVFLRDVSSMGSGLGERALRIAIKDRAGNERVLRTLERILSRVEDPTAVAQPVASGL